MPLYGAYCTNEPIQTTEITDADIFTPTFQAPHNTQLRDPGSNQFTNSHVNPFMNSNLPLTTSLTNLNLPLTTPTTDSNVLVQTNFAHSNEEGQGYQWFGHANENAHWQAPPSMQTDPTLMFAHSDQAPVPTMTMFMWSDEEEQGYQRFIGSHVDENTQALPSMPTETVHLSADGGISQGARSIRSLPAPTFRLDSRSFLHQRRLTPYSREHRLTRDPEPTSDSTVTNIKHSRYSKMKYWKDFLIEMKVLRIAHFNSFLLSIADFGTMTRDVGLLILRHAKGLHSIFWPLDRQSSRFLVNFVITR